MSLIGDALSHAVLPGAAIGFMIAGLSLVSMSIGGFIAGILVALLSGFISRLTNKGRMQVLQHSILYHFQLEF